MRTRPRRGPACSFREPGRRRCPPLARCFDPHAHSARSLARSTTASQPRRSRSGSCLPPTSRTPSPSRVCVALCSNRRPCGWQRGRLRLVFSRQARRRRSRLVDPRPARLAHLAQALHALLRPGRAVLASRRRADPDARGATRAGARRADAPPTALQRPRKADAARVLRDPGAARLGRAVRRPRPCLLRVPLPRQRPDYDPAADARQLAGRVTRRPLR